MITASYRPRVLARAARTLIIIANIRERKMNSRVGLTATALCCTVVVVLSIIGAVPFSDAQQLDPSFYNDTCSDVHSIVRGVLTNVSQSDPRILASLIRLHFHDCFVQVRTMIFFSL